MSDPRIRLYLPHPAQQKILNEQKRFNVVDCGRRWGKSKLAVNILIEPALESFPTGYFTPTYKLLKDTYNDCIRILEPIISRKSDQEFIELATGGIIDFWSLDNPFAGRSRKYKKVVADEAAFAKELFRSWTESIRPTLTDLKGDAWFFSTPKGKNDFYTLYMRGRSGEKDWASWQMSTYTNPYIDPAEIDEAKADLPELAFSQEYMAEFNDNVANPFGLQYIEQCTYPLSSNPPVCFGIDLAKSHDWTVIIGLDKNGSVCYFDRFQKPWGQVVLDINMLPNLPMNVDSTGVGDPIVEKLQTLRGNVHSFKFTQYSKQQIMEGLSLAIQSKKVAFPPGHIKNELEDFEYQYTKTGVKYGAPKDHYDDCVCALALAYDLHKNAVSQGQYSWA